MGVSGAGNFLEVGSLLQGVQKHKLFFWMWYSLKCPYLLKKFVKTERMNNQLEKLEAAKAA